MTYLGQGSRLPIRYVVRPNDLGLHVCRYLWLCAECICCDVGSFRRASGVMGEAMVV